MVRVFLPRLILLASAFVQVTAASMMETFQVPTFDYEALHDGDTPEQLLDALKENGIASLRGIPVYASAREQYLQQAAACTAKTAAGSSDAEFLLQKTLRDGTKRYTISTRAGQELDADANMDAEAQCPGLSQSYHEFSRILERAVSKLALSLDSTSFTVEDGDQRAVSSRKLFGDAVRLDHFHAYEALPSTSDARQLASDTDNLSLEMHEDHGMFIVFATPAFYKVNDDNTVEATATPLDDQTGLVIKTRDNRVVRPVLKPDEVTIMIGTGFNKWVKTSEKLPPVTHGMQMPRIQASGDRVLRAWFGKMTLLPSYQRMLSDMTFEQHSNATTRLLMEANEADHLSVGCAAHRRLASKEVDECMVKVCTRKPGVPKDPSQGTCSSICNRTHGGDNKICNEFCTCTPIRKPGMMCWMFCVEVLPTCPKKNRSCSSDGHTAFAKCLPPTPEPIPTPAPAPQPKPAPASLIPPPSLTRPLISAPTTAPAPITTTTRVPETISTPSPTPVSLEPSPVPTPAPTSIPLNTRSRFEPTPAPEAIPTQVFTATAPLTTNQPSTQALRPAC